MNVLEIIRLRERERESRDGERWIERREGRERDRER